VNNQYLADGTLTYSILEGWWTDAGTFESLLRATNLVAQGGANMVPPLPANKDPSPGRMLEGL
jgi:glucose-1-phosphate thymidylyltransferase